LERLRPTRARPARGPATGVRAAPSPGRARTEAARSQRSPRAAPPFASYRRCPPGKSPVAVRFPLGPRTVGSKRRREAPRSACRAYKGTARPPLACPAASSSRALPVTRHGCRHRRASAFLCFHDLAATPIPPLKSHASSIDPAGLQSRRSGRSSGRRRPTPLR
jgi:hypothetical protein